MLLVPDAVALVLVVAVAVAAAAAATRPPLWARLRRGRGNTGRGFC